jgi:hypothetical protein
MVIIIDNQEIEAHQVHQVRQVRMAILEKADLPASQVRRALTIISINL